jgi:hypothetical protein
MVFIGLSEGIRYERVAVVMTSYKFEVMIDSILTILKLIY